MGEHLRALVGAMIDARRLSARILGTEPTDDDIAASVAASLTRLMKEVTQ
jgi:hypothetical protein